MSRARRCADGEGMGSAGRAFVGPRARARGARDAPARAPRRRLDQPWPSSQNRPVSFSNAPFSQTVPSNSTEPSGPLQVHWKVGPQSGSCPACAGEDASASPPSTRAVRVEPAKIVAPNLRTRFMFAPEESHWLRARSTLLLDDRAESKARTRIRRGSFEQVRPWSDACVILA